MRLVAKQLVSTLDRHDPLYNRSGHNCETALLRVLNDVQCSADGDDLVLLVRLDLSAAVDTNVRDTLLTQMRDEGEATQGKATKSFRRMGSRSYENEKHEKKTQDRQALSMFSKSRSCQT